VLLDTFHPRPPTPARPRLPRRAARRWPAYRASRGAPAPRSRSVATNATVRPPRRPGPKVTAH